MSSPANESVAANITGTVANVSEYILSASAIPLMIEIYRSRSTKDYSVLPQSMGFLAYMTVLTYGLLSDQFYVWLSAILNGLAYLVYIGVHVLFTPVERRRHLMMNTLIPLPLGILIISIGPIASYCANPSAYREFAVEYSGYMYLIYGVFQYTAQLLPLRQILKTKDASSISGWIAGGYIICGICWTSYGVVKRDIFVTVCNAIGVVSAVIQVSLVLAFNRPNASQLFSVSKKEKEVELGFSPETTSLGDL